ncbi:hypothetical protein Cadr_000019159 [Camelus dromedarius]|uniref:Uncharacterized protein n=1 Tax=Camelus dromedarius TaxID=9838 RepID=A0A5N4D1V4_CAMDR|nr:hypothetical protein Cadr_000019159 [Camelus dromedarius]
MFPALGRFHLAGYTRVCRDSKRGRVISWEHIPGVMVVVGSEEVGHQETEPLPLTPEGMNLTTAYSSPIHSSAPPTSPPSSLKGSGAGQTECWVRASRLMRNRRGCQDWQPCHWPGPPGPEPRPGNQEPPSGNQERAVL